MSAGECVLPLFGEDDYRFAVCEQQFRGWDGRQQIRVMRPANRADHLVCEAAAFAFGLSASRDSPVAMPTRAKALSEGLDRVLAHRTVMSL